MPFTFALQQNDMETRPMNFGALKPQHVEVREAIFESVR
jgi:hypothetical protein